MSKTYTELVEEISPQETVVMVLRNHFSLPVPEKWEQNDSWIQTRAEIVY